MLIAIVEYWIKKIHSKITIKDSPELLFDQDEYAGCPSYTVDFIEKLLKIFLIISSLGGRHGVCWKTKQKQQ